MARAYIQDLALEITQTIVLHASKKWDGFPSKENLSQLRLVSWQFRDAVDPLLFSEIKLDFKKRPFADVIQQLDTMARKKTDIRHCVRTLVIDSTEVQLSGSVTKVTYVGLLLLALRSLLEVRSIRWTISHLDGFYTIVDGIVNLPHLEDLYFDFSGFPVLWQAADMIMLHRFTQLQSLGFRAQYPSDPLAGSLIQQLRINSTKQSLTSLAIQFTGVTKNKEVLHEIVRDVPGGSPLKLKHLQAHGWKLSLNPTTIPHLRCLSSLDISRMDQESHARVWFDLMVANIQLKKIAGPISMSLNMYLRSYTGLEHLTITVSRGNGESFSDLCQSLPFHKDTLGFFDGSSGHCATPEDMTAIRACEKLDYLAITVQLGRTNSFGVILGTALEIPHLQIIDINCGGIGGSSRKRQRFEPIIFDVLRSFGERLGCTPIIVCGDRRYNAKEIVGQDIGESG